MYIPLGHDHTGMSRQLHDCKCVSARLAHPLYKLLLVVVSTLMS
jgi:hypothetical protein